MAIKKYIATKDTTITNAFKPNLTTRGTGSNTGMSDSAAVFKIYGQASSGSSELSRALYEFPIFSITSDRASSYIPASGSVSFFLTLYNAEHPFTLPRDYNLVIVPLSRSWDEGHGVDSDEYTDFGYANWEYSSTSSSGLTAWMTQGGDFHELPYIPGTTLPSYTASFAVGDEDLEVNITSLVEEWISGTEDNNGVGIKLDSTTEAALSSVYVKKFYTRGSEYFFKRPAIEARWDDSKKDGRANFFASSSLASSTENTNNLFFYNYIRGQLRDIPSAAGSGSKISLRIWTDTSGGYDVTPTSIAPITASWFETGIYKASFAADLSASTIYDRWSNSSETICYRTGSSITVNSVEDVFYNPNDKYVVSITNLKKEYSQDEKSRVRIFTRDYNWNPNIYTLAVAESQISIIEDLYYSIRRVVDGEVVIQYGTGSVNHTRCSYDLSGSYFDLDMSLLEKDYMYELSFVHKRGSDTFIEAKDKFRFRIKG